MPSHHNLRQAPSKLPVSLRIGRSQALPPDGPLSAIDKQLVEGAIKLLSTGLEGDEQADRQHHGGAEKALHHYPAEHYAAWRGELPGVEPRLQAGGFGENLSSLGLTEDNVCIGDVFRLGEALIQVSQPRQPCWKLNLRFGVADMACRVQETERVGWYYRVLATGSIAIGDPLEFMQRTQPHWPVSEVLRVLYRECLDLSALTTLIHLDELSPNCRALLASRLETGSVEDWSRRLSG